MTGVVLLASRLPMDCITATGQDCNHDEGTTHVWAGLGTLALTMEVLICLAAVAIVLALVMWSQGKWRAARTLAAEHPEPFTDF